jgi:SNF2 family DNA or RNA helicase
MWSSDMTRLRQAGKGVVSLTGANTKKTKQIVDRFQNNPNIQYFIGSMKGSGQGITLTAAQYRGDRRIAQHHGAM